MAALAVISTLSSVAVLSSVFQHWLEVLHPSIACLTSRTANIYTGAAALPLPLSSSVTAGGGQHAGTNRAAIQAAHLSLSPLMSQRAAKNPPKNRALPHSQTLSAVTQPPPASNNLLLVPDESLCRVQILWLICQNAPALPSHRNSSDARHYCADKHINTAARLTNSVPYPLSALSVPLPLLYLSNGRCLDS